MINVVLAVTLVVMVVHSVLLVKLLSFAGEGGRNTAEQGFERDMKISELDARLVTCEREHKKYH